MFLGIYTAASLPGDQFTWLCNIGCGLKLVPGQHPDFNTSISKIIYMNNKQFNKRHSLTKFYLKLYLDHGLGIRTFVETLIVNKIRIKKLK